MEAAGCKCPTSRASPGNGVLDGQRILQPSHPQPRVLDVELISAHLDGLGDAQSMAVDDHQQRVIPGDDSHERAKAALTAGKPPWADHRHDFVRGVRRPRLAPYTHLSP